MKLRQLYKHFYYGSVMAEIGVYISDDYEIFNIESCDDIDSVRLIIL